MNGIRSPERSTHAWSRNLIGAGRVASLAVIAVGVLVLVGWLLDLAALVRVGEGFPGMNPLSAACLVLGGLATWLLADGPEGRHARDGRSLALVIAAIGVLRLAAPARLGEPVGRFLASAWGGRPGWVPMAPATAAALLLVGLGLALADARPLGARRWAQALLLAAMAPAVLSVTLYLYGAPFVPVLAFLRPMAIHTAVGVLTLSCAALLIRPRSGAMAIATGDSIGGSMLRFMLPVVVAVPLALGGLSLLGRGRRLYDTSQGAALVATVTAMLLVTGLWSVARRLTHAEAARRRAEQALAESRLRLDLVLRSIGVGVWDYDIGRDAVTFDDTVAEFWQLGGHRPVPMRRVVDHIHADDRAATVAEVRSALGSGNEFAASYRVLRRDGSIRVVTTRGFVTRDPSGRPVELSGILWDTTIQHEAAAARERIQQQQLELKDQFLSHVSHELRSPLTVIFSFVEILLDGLAGGLNEQQREFLTITHRNAAHLRQMIDDLLEVTRAQTGKLVVHVRRLELAPVVTSTIEDLALQANARRIQLAGDIQTDLPPVLADPDRVRQVLVNLLDNALKFTPEGGSIRVTVEPGPGPAEEIVLSVVDSGPGIPADERERIFRQLHQLDCGAPVSRKGLGLGLYICRELVTRMGARIWVEAVPQGGSAFRFTLPVCSPVSAITSLLTPENLERAEFHLLVVTIRPKSRRAWAERDDAAAATVFEVVRHCTSPDRDLVLPRSGANADAESIGVLACAEASDAAVLVRRIDGQLARCEALASARLAWSLSVRRLDVGPVRGQTARDLAGALSSGVEDAFADLDAWRDAA